MDRVGQELRDAPMGEFPEELPRRRHAYDDRAGWYDPAKGLSCESPKIINHEAFACRGENPDCEACERRFLWNLVNDLKLEVEAAPRTWFVTLTFSREETSYRQFQLFLKRVRKKAGGPLRYYVVSERGSQNGRYHYHALIFCLPALTYRKLSGCWSLGFDKTTLVDSSLDVLQYLLKYVTKAPDVKHGSNGLGNSCATFLAYEDVYPHRAEKAAREAAAWRTRKRARALAKASAPAH